MSIVTVSRGTYSQGRDVAEKLAQRLGYQCISREIMVEAAKEFNIPELKLVEAMQDPPSILERFTYGRERYLAYFQAVLLEHFQKDNVVYHGLVGHFLVRDVAHVLKVRIIAEMEDRVRLMMERKGVTEEYALRFMKRVDETRRKWSLHLYGIDTHDPTLYDIVIRIKKLSTEDATDILCHALELDRFRPTPESRQAIDDLCVAAQVRSAAYSRPASRWLPTAALSTSPSRRRSARRARTPRRRCPVSGSAACRSFCARC